MPGRGFVESAPRAFELALHFVSALHHRGFGVVLGHDRAAGHHVVDVPGERLAGLAPTALDELGHAEFSVLGARAWIGRFDGRHVAGLGRDGDGDADGVDEPCIASIAIIDAVLAGQGWCAAGRSAWSAPEFTETELARAHERLVVAVDDSRAETVTVCRVRGDDASAPPVLDLVRQIVLRELVLRPTFGDAPWDDPVEWVPA